MTTLTGLSLAEAGIDAVALKPTEVDVARATGLDVATLAVDYEGADAVPSRATLDSLTESASVRLTTPVRADGYDPLGDDSRLAGVPDRVGRVLVAGNGAYLSETESSRAIAPRLRAAAEGTEDPWVGTEGVERVALAVGGTQYELLSRSTEREIRALRAAGYEGSVALYAPVVLSDDEDTVLDAVGDYTARRGPVRRALPEDAATDSDATGRGREVLGQAVHDYALVGSPSTVSDRVASLREAGVDTVVAYPARGLDPLL